MYEPHLLQHCEVGADGHIDYLGGNDEGAILEMDSRVLLEDCKRLQREREDARGLARYWFDYARFQQPIGEIEQFSAPTYSRYPWVKDEE